MTRGGPGVPKVGNRQLTRGNLGRKSINLGRTKACFFAKFVKTDVRFGLKPRYG